MISHRAIWHQPGLGARSPGVAHESPSRPSLVIDPALPGSQPLPVPLILMDIARPFDEKEGEDLHTTMEVSPAWSLPVAAIDLEMQGVAVISSCAC